MATHRKSPSKSRRHKGHSAKPYPFEFRIKVVRLYLDDGYPAPLVAEQFGISDYSVYRWAKLYRELGEQGLKVR